MYIVYYICTFLVCFLFKYSGKLLKSYCWGTKSRMSVLNWKSSKRRILLCWTAAWIIPENTGDMEADWIVTFESKLAMSIPRMYFLIPRNLFLRQAGWLSAAFLNLLSFSCAVFWFIYLSPKILQCRTWASRITRSSLLLSHWLHCTLLQLGGLQMPLLLRDLFLNV